MKMMKTNPSKLVLSTSVFFMLLATLVFTSFDNIQANNNHHDNNNQCGTDTYTFDHDGSNSRVEVDFESNDRQIDVFGKNGWTVTKVELDVEDDNHSGFWQYSSGPLNNFNPHPGNRIDKVRVTVYKSCATSTPTVNPTSTPVATMTANPSTQPSVTPDPTETPMPSATASTTPDPISLVCSDGQHLDASGLNCVSFSVPGPSDSGIGGGEINITSGQVLGASTMAATGATEEAIFNSVFALGSLLTSFGIMKNGKKKV